MFPDPFLPRVAVTVGKGSGYARLSCSHDDQEDSDGVGVGSVHSDVLSNDWTEPPSDVTVTFNGTWSNQYIKVTSKT